MTLTIVNKYDFGSLITVHTRDTDDSEPFTDSNTQLPTDPDEVYLTVRSPDGTINTYTYVDGTDSDITREALGAYSAVINANQSGKWYYRWWSAGAGQASMERSFQVKKANALTGLTQLSPKRIWNFEYNDQLVASNTIVELVNFDDIVVMSFEDLAPVAIASAVIDDVDPDVGTDSIVIGTLALPVDDGILRQVHLPITAYGTGVYMITVRAVTDDARDIVRKGVFVVED